MTFIVVVMIAILAIAGVALVFAAYPNRGAKVPGVPWLGDVLERAADAVPTIRDGDLDPTFESEPAPPAHLRAH